jgi:flagellar biogenesis protein FliO
MEERVKGGIHSSRKELFLGFPRALFDWIKSLRPYTTNDMAVLRVESRLSIGQKKELVLINCTNRRFLLAASGDAVTLLTEIGSEISKSKAEIA